MIVKNMHKCHKYHAILHKLCTWFGKNELSYLKEQKFLRLGGGPPLNTPMAGDTVRHYLADVSDKVRVTYNHRRWRSASEPASLQHQHHIIIVIIIVQQQQPWQWSSLVGVLTDKRNF